MSLRGYDSFREAAELGHRRRRAGEVPTRRRKSAVVRQLTRANARCKMRSSTLQRIRALWQVPARDFDLWFCGKVEVSG